MSHPQLASLFFLHGLSLSWVFHVLNSATPQHKRPFLKGPDDDIDPIPPPPSL